MNMGASSKTTAGLMTDPAQGNHTQSNLKKFFSSRPGKNCKTHCKDCSKKSVNQGKFSSPCPGTPSFFNRWRQVWQSCILAGEWGFTTMSPRRWENRSFITGRKKGIWWIFQHQNTICDRSWEAFSQRAQKCPHFVQTLVRKHDLGRS